MRTVAALVVALLLMSTAAEGQAPCAQPSAAASFGDGTWIVGADITPGTYKTPGPTNGVCVWHRLSGFGGTMDEVAGHGASYGGPGVVTITDADKGFMSSGCEGWTLVA